MSHGEADSSIIEVLLGSMGEDPRLPTPPPPAVGYKVCSDCSMHQSMRGGVKVGGEVALQKETPLYKQHQPSPDE